MCKIIQLLYLLRQLIRYHPVYAILAAILHCLLIIPAFEFDHSKRLLHCQDLLLYNFLSLLEKLTALPVDTAALLTPLYKLPDIPDLQPGTFQTLN